MGIPIAEKRPGQRVFTHRGPRQRYDVVDMSLKPRSKKRIVDPEALLHEIYSIPKLGAGFKPKS